MKIVNKEQLHEFLDIARSCKGEVTLESRFGDRYNLKSELSTYIAMGTLLNDKAEDLELFCSDPNDEAKFFKFFYENPGVL